MRDVKFEIIFWIHNHDFTKHIEKHYTTVERLTTGKDKFNYPDVDVIASRQYSGVNDIDGVEIYDGDILTALDGFFVVGFEGGIFIAKVPGCEDWYYLCAYDFKIIGNIYENPELLKGDKNDRN